MQLSHDPAVTDAAFDEANLVSCAGLAPVLALADRAGLSELLAERLTVASPNAPVKVTALVAGMVAGADSIDDMDLLRHGAMDRVFAGVRAPSTLGTFLRSFTFGHVRQLDAVAARLLAQLAAPDGGRTPLLPGADQVAYVDIDDTVRETHGYLKQGAGFGYSGVSGLNALLGIVSTPTAAPVIAAARLRKGSTNSARGAARLVTDTLKTAAAAGADPKTGALVIVRMDSAFCGHDVIAAVRRAGAKFSVTARMNPAVTRAIASIEADAWTPIHYPNAFVDEDTGQLVSDAEVAQVPLFTAFTSRRKHEHVTARLIVRRVKRLNPDAVRSKVPTGQEELFTTWRYHAIFTDSPESMLAAEATHRAHAIVEQVIADLKAGPLAHLPSGVFNANAAWLALASIAFNLLRAAGTLAASRPGRGLAVATTATLRARLITVPARIARSARRLTLHLPTRWPWHEHWTRLADHTLRPAPHSTVA
jgi:Transposase DDE domain group 1